jgi:hypothetical protein
MPFYGHQCPRVVTRGHYPKPVVRSGQHRQYLFPYATAQCTPFRNVFEEGSLSVKRRPKPDALTLRLLHRHFSVHLLVLLQCIALGYFASGDVR